MVATIGPAPDAETAGDTIDGAIEAAAAAAEPDAPLLLLPPVPEAKPAKGLFGFLRRDRVQASLTAPVASDVPGDAMAAGVAMALLDDPADTDGSLALRTAADPSLPLAAPEVLVAGTESDTMSKETLTPQQIATLGLVEPEKTETVKRAGLFGFLRNRDANPSAPPAVAEVEPEKLDDGAPSYAKSLFIEDFVPADDVAQADDVPDVPRRGLGGLFSMRAEAAEPLGTAADASAGTSGLVPFGEVVTACGVRTAEFGSEVARSGGSGTYRLYDTEPVSTLQRAQFVTGFNDGCARRITGALALFGSFDVHEAKRYTTSNKTAYSAVDLAYEKVKSQICHVGRGTPCPENKAERMYRDVQFVTIYPAFGSTREWMEMLLYKGELISYALVAS